MTCQTKGKELVQIKLESRNCTVMQRQTLILLLWLEIENMEKELFTAKKKIQECRSECNVFTGKATS